MGNGGVVAEALLDSGGDLARVRTQPGELLGVSQQRHDAVADEGGGRVVPGHDQLEDGREQLSGVEALVAVAGGDQPAHEVVAESSPFCLDERAQHRHDVVGCGLGQCVLGRRRRGDEQRAEAPPQWLPVVFGHAEQLADDGERQRERESCDEIDPRVGSRSGHLVEEVVHDGLHLRAELFDSAGCEGGRDETAQSAVIGRVDAEHVAGERRSG